MKQRSRVLLLALSLMLVLAVSASATSTPTRKLKHASGPTPTPPDPPGAYVALPGTYVLKLVGQGTDGACADTVQFSQMELSYILLGSSNN